MTEPVSSILPPLAQKEANDGNPSVVKDVSLIYKEFQQLQNENDQYNNELRAIQNRKARIELAMMRLDLRMKTRFSRNVFTYLWYFSGFCGIILILQGINPHFDVNMKYFRIRMHGFEIPQTPLTTLIGSTAASAIGLVAIVLQGLFKAKTELPKTDDKK